MKQNTLKSMTLRNFKGCEKLTINFNGELTTIKGDNGTGKTTVVDAWNWLISGKSTEFKADFDVKTKNPDGTYKHKLEHEVSAIINITGHDRELKRLMKEKWTKKRGSEEEEFTGHETTFYIDEVPCNQTQYLREIETFFINEKTAIMLSNIFYFNSLKWNEQREILTKISPQISQDDIFISMGVHCSETQINHLKTSLSNLKNIDGYTSEIKAKFKKVQDEIKEIPVRISEVHRATESEVNFDEIERLVNVEKAKIEEVEQKIKLEQSSYADRQKQVQEVYKTKSNEKFEMEQSYNSQVRNLSSVYVTKIQDLTTKLNEHKSKLNAHVSEHTKKQQRVIELEGFINQKENLCNNLLEEWKNINKSTLAETNINNSCPTCERPYDLTILEKQKEQAIINFNIKKVEQLEEIENKGNSHRKEQNEFKVEVQEIKSYLQNLQTEIESIKKLIEPIENEIEETKLAQSKTELPQNLIDLKAKIDSFVLPSLSVPESETLGTLQTEKRALEQGINELKVELSKKDAIASNLKRLEELKAQQKTLMTELQKYEGILFAINKYKEIEMSHIERSVNDMFGYVKFRLFETQVNGAEVPTCKCMVNGVDYSDLNTASKINAGIDIVKTLQNHYGLILPLFVDNKESVTRVLDYPHQIICLEVSEGVSNLEIV
jgi:DNA repair protein SbcC/Rad50